ncbi:MAG: inner membrane CreD family protein [Phycisphaerae bacterium]|nr:inner membrane CreD family protein [Phycisphaerae bacterium]
MPYIIAEGITGVCLLAALLQRAPGGAGWRWAGGLGAAALPTPLFLMALAAFGSPLSDAIHPAVVLAAWGAAALVLVLSLGKEANASSTQALAAVAVLAVLAAAYTADALLRSEIPPELAGFPAAALVNQVLLWCVMLRIRGYVRAPQPAWRVPAWIRRWNMSVLRFFAIALIFGAVTVAWMILGGTVWFRTESLDRRLGAEMKGLWGPEVLVQRAPHWRPAGAANDAEAHHLAPSASDVAVAIRHEHRYKGLLWYSTFTADFDATYSFAPRDDAGSGHVVFDLPPGVNTYDAMLVALDGRRIRPSEGDIAAGRLTVPVGAGAEHTVRIRYVTQGRNAWVYAPSGAEDATAPAYDDVTGRCGTVDTLGEGPMGRLRNFRLTVQTDFDAIDYPDGTRSPSRPAQSADGGMRATWHYDNALTRQPMGVSMPQRTNAGPIVARMSFFAPVSLLFFFTVLFTLVVRKGIALHPMHYLFIAAGFFAFHILLAYLADVMPAQPAFWIAAGVSTLLVVSYMRLVAGIRFAVAGVGLVQLVYLVGFSYAFFWQGNTGLTVTVGAVVTLFLLMQATGRINWHEVFGRATANRPPVQPPANAPTGDATPPAPPQ